MRTSITPWQKLYLEDITLPPQRSKAHLLLPKLK
jgi:hypothetical protein